MNTSRFVKVGIIILIVLLSIDIGSRILLYTSEVAAAGKVEYKVVSLQSMNSDAEYEELLNNMADQGWELYETVGRFSVFKK